MKKACLSLFLFFVLSSLVFPQEYNNREMQELERNFRAYKDFFENKINQFHRNSLEAAGLFHFVHPEQLPLWVFMPMEADADSIFIIGVSDPGMDEESGLELALQRALIINGLAGVVDVANMREQYSTERNNVIQIFYSDYTQLSCISRAGIDDLQIIKKHRTQYDETIVLARIKKTENKQSASEKTDWQIHTGLFTRVTTINSRIQFDEQLILHMNPRHAPDEKTYAHQYSKINRIVNTRTELNAEIISDLPALNLRYVVSREQSDSMKVNDINSNGQSLNNGLWHAMLAAMLSSIADEAHTGSIHFSQVSDMYDRLMVSLSSELVRVQLRSSLPALYVIDNHLFLFMSPEVLNSD